eukprot:TRINITY_DN12324_c1_g1_i3.p2 TRINITY_DN12324_c1_g1~~TRINITY_DN12324_c1_g1_i3.p2  ORF type:complete len:327 (+),score=29.58 TRINITY_DN12324_c1_g1_i3:2316-3296(+)
MAMTPEDKFWQIALKHPTRIKRLNAASQELQRLPNKVSECKSLQTLSLRSNRFAYIPQTLRSLQLFSNHLQSISGSCLRSLSRLTTLNLNFNQLETLPAEIGNLTSLKEISVDGNRLTELPESISKLSRLQVLSLKGNLLEDVPAGLWELPELVSVNLLDNELGHVPFEMLNSSSLRDVDLSMNAISLLPESMTRQPWPRQLQLHLARNPFRRPSQQLEPIDKPNYIPTLKELAMRRLLGLRHGNKANSSATPGQLPPELEQLLDDHQSCPECQGFIVEHAVPVVVFVQPARMQGIDGLPVETPLAMMVCSQACLKKGEEAYYKIP